MTPTRVTTDKATSYPKALQAKLPDLEHRCSQYLNKGIERDHQHLEGRARPLRRFAYPQGEGASASNFCQGHIVMRKLARGHSARTDQVRLRQRIARAWS